MQTLHSFSHCEATKKPQRGREDDLAGPSDPEAAAGLEIDFFQQLDCLIPADTDDLFIEMHFIPPDRSNCERTAAAAEPIDMFSKGLMQKQEPVPKQRCVDVYGTGGRFISHENRLLFLMCCQLIKQLSQPRLLILETSLSPSIHAFLPSLLPHTLTRTKCHK